MENTPGGMYAEAVRLLKLSKGYTQQEIDDEERYGPSYAKAEEWLKKSKE